MDSKNTNRNSNSDNEKINKPGDIKGKIEIKDTRERKDGPGGN